MIWRVLLVAWTMGCGKAETGGGTGGPGPTTTGPLSLTGDAVNGEAVYSSTCAVCHLDDGSGTGPSLSGEVPDSSDSALVDVMLNGEGAMPAQALTDQEVADVLAYLRATFG